MGRNQGRVRFQVKSPTQPDAMRITGVQYILVCTELVKSSPERGIGIVYYLSDFLSRSILISRIPFYPFNVMVVLFLAFSVQSSILSYSPIRFTVEDSRFLEWLIISTVILWSIYEFMLCDI
jgi:hypothetical protein